jgi:hypothetical protein
MENVAGASDSIQLTDLENQTLIQALINETPGKYFQNQPTG